MGRKRRTKSVLIAEALAEDIRVGKYKEAAIFPSVRMLARRFDVAFETARESVRMLEVCGLVIRKGSEGTFLTEPETFLWDGLALIQRGDEQFINEPHVGNAPKKLCFGGKPQAKRRARRARKGPRGNPVASLKGTSYFNDMLGTIVGSSGRSQGISRRKATSSRTT